jgi:hypothetical protein
MKSLICCCPKHCGITSSPEFGYQNIAILQSYEANEIVVALVSNFNVANI